MDGCSFAEQSTWSQNRSISVFQENKPAARQFINEASDLKDVNNESFDFLPASNVIEHVTNLIKAIREWCRIVREDGFLTTIIPHRDGTFDHLRPFTSFEHLLSDFENNTDETDVTHFPEILKLHELGKDTFAGSFSQFRGRAEQNIDYRTIRHLACTQASQLLPPANHGCRY